MHIIKDVVVSIDYTLTDSDGTVLDSSRGQKPLDYLHGSGNIISGLEEALEGKRAGESIKVNVPPRERLWHAQRGLESQSAPQDVRLNK